MSLFVLTFPRRALDRFCRRVIFRIPQLFIDDYNNLFVLGKEILINICRHCKCRSFEFSNCSNRVLIPVIKKYFYFVREERVNIDLVVHNDFNLLLKGGKCSSWLQWLSQPLFTFSNSTMETADWNQLQIKGILWHRCFPANFARFLRTSFIIEYLWWLLLKTCFSVIFSTANDAN